MDIDEALPAVEESEGQPHQLEVFIPGTHVLAKDEILEPDDSVYIMRHSMDVTWSCLSFDVLRDSLGDERQRYPATAYVVAGTQAARADQNELSVFKMSSLHRTQRDGGSLSASGFHHTFDCVRLQMMMTTRTMTTTPLMKMQFSSFAPYPTMVVSIASVPSPFRRPHLWFPSRNPTTPQLGLKLARSIYGTSDRS